MINLLTAEHIVSIGLLLIVYFSSISINGYIQSWVALKLGDDTPEQSGFLTLNPMAHIDILGFIVLLFSRFGWGKFIPFNYLNIHGKNKTEKMALLYGTETLVSLGLSLIALICAIIFYGPHVFSLLVTLFLEEKVPLKGSTQIYSDKSSFAIVIGLLLLTYVFFNIFVAVLSLILNGFRFILSLGFENNYKYMEYADYLSILAPIIVIFLFANFLRHILLHLIMWLAFKISFLFGVS